MSFKDLRNFTEMMRSLGYPRQISMENFRQPNFPLVAEILMWLVKRYEPNANLPHDIDSEDDRVIFIKYVSQFMATKTRLKLNPKKLYMADGYSVQEMLKVVTLLYNAVRSNTAAEENEDVTERSFDISNKIADLKQARQLATEITMNGARLYELLSVEVELRELRTAAVNRPLEMSNIESGMKDKILTVENSIKGTQHKLDNVANDEANLEAKIEKKKAELERNSKRLRSLQNVRPAFMDEFEKLESELKRLYEVYGEKFRNLTYLEQIVDSYDRQQQVRVEETEKQLKRMQDQMREEEKRLLNQEDTFENLVDDSDGEVKIRKNPRVVGGMEGSDSESENESEYSSSGSELAGDGEMPISDDDEEEDESDSENFDDKDDSDDIDF